MTTPSILTLTMNPAVDESASIDRLIPERKMRCQALRHEPGGGGINVARAIRKLGGEALAIYPSGGPMGELLEGLLDLESVHQMPVAIRGWTRSNLNVLETSTGRQYRFVMPGPELAGTEWQRFLEILRGFRPAPAYIVASGSLPRGVPPDFYARLADLSREKGARLVLDTSGDPLRLAVRRGIFLVKPSLAEFSELVGEQAGEKELVSRARAFLRESRTEILVVSLGSSGAIWLTAGGEQGRIASPAVAVRSTVGAGDSLVAGIVLAHSRGRPLADAVRFGVAAAAAACMNPGTELCRLADAEALDARLATHPLGAGEPQPFPAMPFAS
ncbi:MAG TPA: 1-phosphofructokinase family hexose kinase [Thermoanaerobaculia bacterium]